MIDFKITMAANECGTVVSVLGYTGTLTINTEEKTRTIEYKLTDMAEALVKTTELHGLLKQPYEIIF